MADPYHFEHWAFGDIWDAYIVLDKDLGDLIDSWNLRHGLKFWINRNDALPYKEIRKLYQEQYGSYFQGYREED